MRYLSSSPAKASVHFVIWENWEVWKIWDPTDILRHAWNGSWWGCENVNNKLFSDYNTDAGRLAAVKKYLIKNIWD